jgi:hypothetical protein
MVHFIGVKSMKEYKETVNCLCHTHAIEVSCLNDDDFKDDTVYITLWYMGKNHSPALFPRIKAAWQMLTSGYANDDILLDKVKTVQLRDALNVILDESSEQSTPPNKG